VLDGDEAMLLLAMLESDGLVESLLVADGIVEDVGVAESVEDMTDDTDDEATGDEDVELEFPALAGSSEPSSGESRSELGSSMLGSVDGSTPSEGGAILSSPELSDEEEEVGRGEG